MAGLRARHFFLWHSYANNPFRTGQNLQMKSSTVSGSPDRHATLPTLLKEAVAAHERGRLDDAYPLYREFIEATPGHPMALQMFGLLHSQRGDYPTAIALMQESLRLFPGQPEAANNLGNALKRSGNREAAIAWYRHALELQPDHIDARRNLGLCQLTLGQSGDAIASFQHCLDWISVPITRRLTTTSAFAGGCSDGPRMPCNITRPRERWASTARNCT